MIDAPNVVPGSPRSLPAFDPIRAAWDDELDGPRPYAAGTWDPAAALISRDGCEWHEES